MGTRVETLSVRALVFMTSVVAFGCSSSGYNAGEMNSALQSAKPSYASGGFSNQSVAEIEAMKPQLKLPARIAIAPPVQTFRRWQGNDPLDTWTPEEVSILESWEQPLRTAGIASQVFVLPRALIGDCESRDNYCRVDAPRQAAARAHADALLIVNLATATDEYANPASAFYLTVIGMWLAPGSHRDALTIAEGMLIDNRNEYLYAFARGQGESRSLRPYMYADTAAVVHSSRVEALKSFGTAFLEQARQLSVK